MVLKHNEIPFRKLEKIEKVKRNICFYFIKNHNDFLSVHYSTLNSLLKNLVIAL